MLAKFTHFLPVTYQSSAQLDGHVVFSQSHFVLKVMFASRQLFSKIHSLFVARIGIWEYYVRLRGNMMRIMHKVTCVALLYNTRRIGTSNAQKCIGSIIAFLFFYKRTWDDRKGSRYIECRSSAVPSMLNDKRLVQHGSLS